MKHFISLLLSILLIFSLVGCTIPPYDTPPDDSDDTDDTQDPTPEPSPAEPFISNDFFVTESGNLQIALTTGQELQWGTSVNVFDADRYGTDALLLRPAFLKLANDGKIPEGIVLKAPIYGSDGRVSKYANTICGPYNAAFGKYVASSDLGLRAVGLSSGVTDREKDYKNAAKTAIELSVKAKNAAIVSMTTHGSNLATIVFKRATDPDVTYIKAELDTLKSMVDSLVSKEGAVTYIEQAYMHYILGYVASAAVQSSVDAKKEDVDTLWNTVHSLVNTAGTSITDVKAALAAAGVTLPIELYENISKFEATKATTLAAQEKLNTIENKDEYTWEEISDAVAGLASVDTTEVNGFKAVDVMENMNEILKAMASDGLSILTQTGGGVYADIADHCGNYKTSVVISKIPYKGLQLENVQATINVTTSVASTHVASCETMFEQLEAPIGSDAIKEIRAYVVDLSLRAQTPDTKVYLNTGELTTAQDGKIAASAMSFSSETVNTHTIQSLIGCVRIVFFDTDNLTILGEAKLDAENALLTEESVIAPLTMDDKQGTAHLFEIPANTTAKISVLIYVDSDAVSNAKISHTAVASIQSSIQLAFSDAEQP